MFYSKSQAAFLLTCEKLFDTWPHPYFWTFTFRKVYPDWYYPNAWAAFTTELGNLHGGMLMGVRVIEPHETHGLHYHAIINLRVSCHLVNRVAKRFGLGRVSVERCNMGAAHYLVPYLNKTQPLAKGMRRWGTIGGFKGVNTNAIVVDSPFQRNMTLLNQGRKVGYKICNEVYKFTMLLGEFKDWPKSVKEYGRVIANPNVDRSSVCWFQRSLPPKLRKVADEHVATKPGNKVYRVNAGPGMLTWDTIRKPHRVLHEGAPGIR